MKNIFRFLIIFLFVGLLCGSLWAKEKKMIAVLPFVVNSAENIDYVKQGIWDMLSSRISVTDKIDVVSKDVTINALKNESNKAMTLADVYGIGKKMDVDYVVWGSITKIGNSLSIDGKLMDIAAYKSTVNIFTHAQGMDDVIPKINDFAQRIDQQISGIVPPSQGATALPQAQEKSPQYTRESEIISGMRSSKRGTLTSFINPDFINAPEAIDRKNFWMSERYPTEFKGMDIGDVNNDGINEVVIIDSRNISIYQKKDKKLILIQKIPGKSYDNFLSVDIADINQNGTKEIIVTNLPGDTLESFVIEFKDGKFVPIASKLRWFLRVINTAKGPVLLGQLRGFETPFNTPIHQIIWEDGMYQEGRKMKIPVGLSVFGLTMDSLAANGAERIIAIDEDGYLNIYEQTDKALAKLQVFGGSNERLWKSEEIYGGGNNAIETGLRSAPDSPDKSNTYINARILTHDSKKDGKKQIIMIKNLSSTGQIFKNVKLYSSSEIYELEWDGLGFLENWKTKKINGYIADIQFKDIDNDGENEIVLSLVLSVKLGYKATSAIVVYKMNPQQGG
jgi:TolB-like protein